MDDTTIRDTDPQRMKKTGRRMFHAAFEDEEVTPSDIFFGALDMIDAIMRQFPTMRGPGIEIMKMNADSYVGLGIMDDPVKKEVVEERSDNVVKFKGAKGICEDDENVG